MFLKSSDIEVRKTNQPAKILDQSITCNFQSHKSNMRPSVRWKKTGQNAKWRQEYKNLVTKLVKANIENFQKQTVLKSIENS